jgi:hypothetical protein
LNSSQIIYTHPNLQIPNADLWKLEKLTCIGSILGKALLGLAIRSAFSFVGFQRGRTASNSENRQKIISFALPKEYF